MRGGKVVPMVVLGHFGRMGYALGICLGEVRREQLSSRWRPSRVCPLSVFAEPKPGASWEIVRMDAGLEGMFRVPLAYFPEAEWSEGSNGFGCVEDAQGTVRAATEEEARDFLAWNPPGAPNGYFLEDDLRRFVAELSRKAASRN